MDHKKSITIDGITCFKPEVSENHTDYPSSGLDELYAVEKENFWFITRRERIISTFTRYVSKTSQIFEIGAGTGYVAQGLQKEGYKIAIGEIHLSGLRYAKKNGISECYQFDLFTPPFQNEFNAIGMFDVLEHFEKDVLALTQVSKMLKPEGILLVSVPAHQWLWGQDDILAAHKRRYNKASLIATINKSGLEVLEAKYFFITILPLLYLRKILNRNKENEKIRNNSFHIHPMLNKILLSIIRLENHISNWLPNIAGGSLLIVAQRKK
ncbi:MAG: class I SAM-dependent methyltransferase [Gammaproteobacteria bacterium]|nr:class I SAM-dependent methyltransferase [Gammaproteobacteria bacterium]